MRQKSEARTDQIFAALSNPTRRRILELLKDGDRRAGELVAAFPALPQPAISRQLRILREAGLVGVSPHAQQRIYRINPDAMLKLEEWAKQMTQRLDALGAVVEEGGEEP